VAYVAAVVCRPQHDWQLPLFTDSWLPWATHALPMLTGASVTRMVFCTAAMVWFPGSTQCTADVDAMLLS
jgi:hypothetical protein